MTNRGAYQKGTEEVQAMEEQVLSMQGLSVAQVLRLLEALMDEAQESFAPLACGAYSVPCAPDTTKFSATVSGMVERQKNLAIPLSGGGVRVYRDFLKIGSAIEYRKREAIYEAFRVAVARETGIVLNRPGRFTTNFVNTASQCLDGRVHVDLQFGTNWGGIGVLTEPPQTLRSTA